MQLPDRNFSAILGAQFLTALADNALLFAAIALLQTLSAPVWQIPFLQQSFALAAIVLAPFVGPMADEFPKSRVMLISNTIKCLGCFSMLLGLNPVVAYGLVGVGSALYTPAKYGILTEYFQAEHLVWANGWMEGLTVAAIIIGAIVGGYLTGTQIDQMVARGLATDLMGLHLAIESTPAFAITVILLIYASASIVNLYIPTLPVHHIPPRHTPGFLIKDFYRVSRLLWTDPLGQTSLAITTLFWGAGSTLRLVILAWGMAILNLSLEHATALTAVVAVGVGIGASIAGASVPLDHAVRVIRVGILMGITVGVTVFITDWRLAIVLLLFIGMMGGYFLVPMNALLQHRGQMLMGAGHSIAVQNCNENLGILLILGAYALMLKADWGIQASALALGAFLALMTALMAYLHGHDQDQGQY
ncbi:MAG: hypothetical protein RIQ52_256 [Pseudomonadota bacterium]|jgi:MFS family permease